MKHISNIAYYEGTFSERLARVNASPPFLPEHGSVWFETDTKLTYRWEGTAWTCLGGYYQDVAGIQKRLCGGIPAGGTGWEGFEGSSIPSGWQYATAAPFATPAGTLVSGSILSITPGATANERAFLYKSGAPGNYSYAHLQTNLVAVNSFFGFRADSTSDYDYVECGIEYIGPMQYAITLISKKGILEPVVTQRSTVYLPYSDVILLFYISGTLWTNWRAEPIIASLGTMYFSTRCGITVDSLAFPPTRTGLTYRKGNSTNTWFKAWCDWVSLTVS